MPLKNLLKKLDQKKEKLKSFQLFNEDIQKNMEEWFKVELTYTSNAIEGNTLTRQETALVIDKGLTVEGKTLKEHLEAQNHAQALAYIKTLASLKRNSLTEKHILNIHEIILDKIDDRHAGRYRNIPVRIAGSTVILPNPLKVPLLMKDFIKWLNEHSGHPVQISADAHFKLVSIHPFIDGNGRTARLLMNLILMQEGYPPALIRKEDRKNYINALEKGQTTNDLEDYYRLVFSAIDRSFEIYFETLESQNRKTETKKTLLKIGKLAKATGEEIHTLRFWTKEGLLESPETTRGGYQLFDSSMIDRVKEIRNLQKNQRLTISEIKEKLKH